MKIEILDRAQEDLVAGFHFYERHQDGLGLRFIESLFADIERLKHLAGIHLKIRGKYHRMLAKRFPCAIFYTVSQETVQVHAVLDCRRNPEWINDRLGS